MKRLLITGFEPFGGQVINPSWEALRYLPSEINGYELTRLCIPVRFGEAAKIVINDAEKICADVIICVGQAGSRDTITPEYTAINLRYAEIPDNNGYHPKDEPVIEGDANAYFTTLPVRKITEAQNSAGVPSKVSYSAGVYVCNDVFYTLLSRFKNSNVRVGFIHVPYCKEQSKEPAMDINDIVKGLIIAVENIDG